MVEAWRLTAQVYHTRDCSPNQRWAYLLLGSQQEAAEALHVLPGFLFRGVALSVAAAKPLDGEPPLFEAVRIPTTLCSTIATRRHVTVMLRIYMINAIMMHTGTNRVVKEARPADSRSRVHSGAACGQIA